MKNLILFILAVCMAAFLMTSCSQKTGPSNKTVSRILKHKNGYRIVATGDGRMKVKHGF